MTRKRKKQHPILYCMFFIFCITFFTVSFYFVNSFINKKNPFSKQEEIYLCNNTNKLFQNKINNKNIIKKEIYTIYKLGDRNEKIYFIQERLNKFGYIEIHKTGIFDNDTKDAIKNFQNRLKLSCDGIVGYDTLLELKKEPTEETKLKGYDAPEVLNPNYLEKEVNSKNIYSNTEYFIYVNLYEHKVNILKGQNKHWKVIKSFACSNGKPSTPTIKGYYNIGVKGYSFGQDHGYCCKYYTQICGNYLFHSVLYNRSGSYIIDGRLGYSISKGCIRLDTQNAKWIFDNIPKNTLVFIK